MSFAVYSQQHQHVQHVGQQHTFSFPMLSSSEILATWDDVPLQAKDLEKPTPQSVRAVYEVLCEQCIGPCVREEMNCPLESAIGHIEYPELYEEGIQQMTFFRNLGRLLSAAGVRDLSIQDILKPDPKRFKRNLCAIINFQKFRVERLEAFEKLHMEIARLCEEKAALDDEVIAIEDKINSLQEQRAAEQPQVDRLKEECRVLEQELKQSNKEHATLQNEMKNLKTKSNELKDYLATLRFQKLNVQQETERLAKNIVRSPERLKSELSEQRRVLEADRLENQRLEDKQRELARRDEQMEQAEQQSGQLLQTIRECEQGMMEAKAAAKETKAATLAVQNHGNVMKQLATQRQEAERQIGIAEERLTRLEKTKALKLAAASHALNESRRERDVLQQHSLKLKSQRDDSQNEIARLESEIVRSKELHVTEMEKRRLAFQRLDNLIEQSPKALFRRIADM